DSRAAPRVARMRDRHRKAVRPIRHRSVTETHWLRALVVRVLRWRRQTRSASLTQHRPARARPCPHWLLHVARRALERSASHSEMVRRANGLGHSRCKNARAAFQDKRTDVLARLAITRAARLRSGAEHCRNAIRR